MSTSAHEHRAHGHDYRLPTLPDAVDIFDTTLRDGSQQEGLSLTVDDKLRVAEQLDHLGVTYIEGGWPGANPKDEAFFARAPAELHLSTATLVAFGSTRRAGVSAAKDPVLDQLVRSQAPVACIVAKSWDRHVEDALRTSLEEGVAMVGDLRQTLLGGALTPASRERLQGWMVGCKTGLTQLRAGLPSDWRVGDKTGNDGHTTTNDIAVAWTPRGPIVIVCYITEAGGSSSDARQAAIADVGRIVAQGFRPAEARHG